MASVDRFSEITAQSEWFSDAYRFETSKRTPSFESFVHSTTKIPQVPKADRASFFPENVYDVESGVRGTVTMARRNFVFANGHTRLEMFPVSSG